MTAFATIIAVGEDRFVVGSAVGVSVSSELGPVQLKEPTVLRHTASSWQVLVPIVHSLTSQPPAWASKSWPVAAQAEIPWMVAVIGNAVGVELGDAVGVELMGDRVGVELMGDGVGVELMGDRVGVEL